jgi:hypothetical protein
MALKINPNKDFNALDKIEMRACVAQTNQVQKFSLVGGTLAKTLAKVTKGESFLGGCTFCRTIKRKVR